MTSWWRSTLATTLTCGRPPMPVEWLPRPKPAGSAPLVRLLDLGCGSGASTRAVQLAAQAAGRAIRHRGVDASAGMLEQAHGKRWPRVSASRWARLRILPGRGIVGLGGSIQGAFAAYLFRNVADRDAVLAGSSSCSPTAACWSFRSTRLRAVRRGWSGLWCAGWWSFLLVG